MFKDKSIKNGIVASLFASIIFLAILQPIMKFVWNLLNKTTIKVYSNYLDSIYRLAAKGHKNDIDFILIAVLISGLIGVFIFVTFVLSRQLKKQREDEDISQINNSEEQEIIIKKKLEDLETRYKKLIRWGHRLLKFFLLSMVFFVIIFTSSLFSLYADLQLNTVFNQKINAIAPYINESQEKILVSKWALMKSKKDYIEIKQMIDTIAKSNNLELPKDLIK